MDLDVMKIKKGMVFYIDDDTEDKYNASYQTKKGEIKKDNTIKGRRPWLVISDDKFNRELGTVEVVPMTGSNFNYISMISENLYHIVKTHKGNSYVLINQAKTVNCPELISYQFTINSHVVDEICRKRAIYLGVFPEDIKIKEDIENNIKQERSNIKINFKKLDLVKDRNEILEIIHIYDDNKINNILDKYSFKNASELDKKINEWCRKLHCRESINITNEEEFVNYYSKHGIEKTMEKFNIKNSQKPLIYNRVYDIRKKLKMKHPNQQKQLKLVK